MGIVDPVLDMTKQRLRDVEQPDQGHLASRYSNWDWNLALLFLNFYTDLQRT